MTETREKTQMNLVKVLPGSQPESLSMCDETQPIFSLAPIPAQVDR